MVDFYKKDRPTPLDDLLRFYHLAKGSSSSILKTVTGTLLHITDALAKPAKKFTATLEPIQDLHGQDAPYPSGGGVNKINPTLPVTITSQTTIAQYATDKKTVWSATVKATNNSQIISRVNILIYNGSSFVSQHTQDIPVGATNQLVSVTADCTNIDYSLILVSISGATAGYSATISEAQLNEGQPLDYIAPYSNICPITGHTGVSVVRTGKNLWTSTYFTDNGFTESNGVYSGLSQNINNVSLTIPEANRVAMSLDYKGESSTRSGYFRFIYSDGTANYPIDCRSDTWASYYAVSAEGKTVVGIDFLRSNALNIQVKNFQLELGSTATTYEPYSTQTIPITFPDAAGTVYGGTLTNEDGEWKLTSNMAVAEFDGSSDESWTKNAANEFYIPLNSLKKTSNYFGLIICDKLKTYRVASSDIPNYGITGYVNTGYPNQNWLYVYLTGNETVGELRSFLSENPITVVYELATPIDYTLTESQALTLLKGENVVWCDASDDLELQYYAKAEETP